MVDPGKGLAEELLELHAHGRFNRHACDPICASNLQSRETRVLVAMDQRGPGWIASQVSRLASAASTMGFHRSIVRSKTFMSKLVAVRNSRTSTPSGPAS